MGQLLSGLGSSSSSRSHFPGAEVSVLLTAMPWPHGAQHCLALQTAQSCRGHPRAEQQSPRGLLEVQGTLISALGWREALDETGAGGRPPAGRAAGMPGSSWAGCTAPLPHTASTLLLPPGTGQSDRSPKHPQALNGNLPWAGRKSALEMLPLSPQTEQQDQPQPSHSSDLQAGDQLEQLTASATKLRLPRACTEQKPSIDTRQKANLQHPCTTGE